MPPSRDRAPHGGDGTAHSATALPDLDDLRRGSDEAWERAVRLLGPSLLGFVTVRGATDPEALLGDVFLDLSRAMNRLDGDWASFRTLAFVIARRRLVDEMRSLARRPMPRPLDRQKLEPQGGDVEEEAIAALQHEEMLAYLGLLTPIQQEVLTLRFVSGLSIREVADVTGLTETSVKANQRRGIASLRRLLAGSNPTPSPAPTGDLGIEAGRL